VSTVAIIPARGNSKRLSSKNVRVLGGQPLIAYSIQAALGAKRVDALYVTTEDAEIADVARRYGARVVRRPQELAGDDIGNTSVVRHALGEIDRPDCFDSVVLLQPTSPFRSSEDIDSSLKLLDQSGVTSVVTVTTVEHHPAKCVSLDRGRVIPYTSRIEMEMRFQSLPTVYRQNGAVYAVGIADFLTNMKFCVDPCGAHIMPVERSVDIDTEFDLRLAEFLLADVKG
jgi:CMP-N,N'-diacetyllegionaminic acid synthase